MTRQVVLGFCQDDASANKAEDKAELVLESDVGFQESARPRDQLTKIEVPSSDSDSAAIRDRAGRIS